MQLYVQLMHVRIYVSTRCYLLWTPGYIYARGETIYRNIAILQYSLLQYNTIWPIENIDILHIAIYCNILLDIVLFVAD